MMHITSLSALMLAMLCASSAWSDTTIVSKGVAQTAIYVDAAATAGEKAGADELAAYFRKISGADVPRTAELPKAGIVLATADSPAAPAQLQTALNGRKDESFAFKTLGGRLYIVGKTQVGAYFGAVTLLQDCLGVRWFLPGDDGEYVPKSRDIVLPDLDRVEEPAFAWRLLSQTGAGGPALDSHIWAFRNKLQAPPAFWYGQRFKPEYKDFYDARLADHLLTDGGHTTYNNAAPPKQFVDSNPEFFALVNGKRTRNFGHHDTHYCLSNPELQNRVVDYICNLRKTYGKQLTYLFGCPDSVQGWCECDACRALDSDGVFDVSRRFHAVAQSIARRVYEKCPDAQLETWAYANYRSIPKDIPIDNRMVVYFCSHGRCFAHALDDPKCARNAEMLDLLKQWQKLNPRIRLYEYAHCTPMNWTPLEKTLAHDLRLFRKMGIIGWKEEVSFPDALWPPYKNLPSLDENPEHSRHRLGQEWLYFNVAARLTWNPDLDVDDVIADIESKYYGKAYPAMKTFNDLRRQAWDNCSGCFGYPTGDSRTPMLLQKDGLKEQLVALLGKADKLAKGDAVLEARLHRDRVYLNHFWIKSNDIYRQRQSSALAAPAIQTPVAIDGNGDDPAWTGATYISNFRLLNVYKPEDGGDKELPANLRTSVGCLSDDKAFYFLVQANEPHPEKLKANATRDGQLWTDDSIEFFLDPMNEANAYYQIIVNTKGQIFDARQPGSRLDADFGVTAAVKIHEDRYVMEVRIPVAAMEGLFKPGLNWRIQFARNRTIADGNLKGCATLFGEHPHLRASYSTITIGNPLLKNGDFSAIDTKTKAPKSWELNDKCQVKKITGRKNNIALAPGGQLFNLIWDWKGPLGQSPRPRPIRVVLRAKGTAILNVFAVPYHDDWSANTLKRKRFPGETIAKFNLADGDFKPFEAAYTIKPEQWIGLYIRAEKGDAELEAVSVMLQ